MPVDLQDESYESDYYFPTAGMARRQERKFKRTEDKEREDVVRRRIGYIGEIGGAFQGAREKAQMDRMLQNSLQQPSSQQPSSQMAQAQAGMGGQQQTYDPVAQMMAAQQQQASKSPGFFGGLRDRFSQGVPPKMAEAYLGELMKAKAESAYPKQYSSPFGMFGAMPSSQAGQVQQAQGQVPPPPQNGAYFENGQWFDKFGNPV